ncbi:Metal-binding protein [Candidatus Hydrogenisulfobacillus filiaventi]|uniref:Metal-binding protein n=1 Tax=Candidatus Hydrogenisulfobacillus filiaventi TaxID=2707344 RepID=A0A6F8ZH84_9FIRM|nr:Metal-binding protein [Candidatus Hydrogenisulfobacillus filiaventi]
MHARHRLTLAALGTLTLAAAGCGSAAPAAQSPTQVSVAYAGSLAYVNDRQLAPVFTRQTGIAYRGQGGGSFGIARELAAGALKADVFESLGEKPITILEPRLTRWSVSLAASPLVIAYNPRSPYAPYFRQVAAGRRSLAGLFRFLATHPGVHLGRTNPATDPQGQAFYEMVELAVRQYHLPAGDPAAILGAWNNPRQVFSEEGILTQLQAGGLDLASAFLPEAKQRHLPYIPLPATLNFSDPALASWYGSATVPLPSGPVHGGPLAVVATVLHNSRAGTRYLAFLLSARGRRILTANGYPAITPAIYGDRAAVPAAVREEIRP